MITIGASSLKLGHFQIGIGLHGWYLGLYIGCAVLFIQYTPKEAEFHE